MELMNSEGESEKVTTFDIEFWGPFSNRNRTSGPDEMDQESDSDFEASAEYVGYLNEMIPRPNTRIFDEPEEEP